MSGGHSETLRRNKPKICKYLNPNVELLAILESCDALTSDEVHQIRSKSTDLEKSYELVDILQRKPESAFRSFIDALQETEQGHVSNLLQGDTDPNNMPMSREHLGKLKEKKRDVCKYLNPDVDLLAYLQSRQVLTSCDAERIRNKQTRMEQSEELLRILERKPDSAFDRFIAGLKNTKQSYVAFILTQDCQRELHIQECIFRSLDEKRCELIDNMIPIDSNLVDELMAQKVMTDEEYETIKAKGSIYEQNVYLIDIFKRKSALDLVCFLRTLEKTGQNHLVRHMEATVSINIDNPELERIVVELMRGGELLPELHVYGIYSRAEHGSIKIRFWCMSDDSVTKLRQLSGDGAIDKLLYDKYGCNFSGQGLHSMRVSIPISEFECPQSRRIMSQEHRRLLQSASERFASKLTVSERLLSRLPFCNRLRQAILSRSTPEERSRFLFDMVSRQAHSAFQQFVDALRETGNGVVAEFLQPRSRYSRKGYASPKQSEKQPDELSTCQQYLVDGIKSFQSDLVTKIDGQTKEATDDIRELVENLVESLLCFVVNWVLQTLRNLIEEKTTRTRNTFLHTLDNTEGNLLQNIKFGVRTNAKETEDDREHKLTILSSDSIKAHKSEKTIVISTASAK